MAQKKLINPHGNHLVERVLYGAKREAALERAQRLPKLELSPRSLADIRCIATGIYSPLTGFVSEENYYSICHDMRLSQGLSQGLAWSIPISLQVQEDNYALDSELALCYQGAIVALLTISSKYRPDQQQEAQKIYATQDSAHPGVAAMQAAGSLYLGGDINVVADFSGDYASGLGENFPEYAFTPRQYAFTPRQYAFTPRQTRAYFAEQDWNTVAAFQTRNPIHRAHEYLTKVALEMVDGLFMNPLVGATKTDDIPAAVRMQCYQTIIKHYYNPARVLLGTYPAAMRYAGPREAILHAISRQNYGCSHFIVGRDHAGVSDYYSTYAAQEIFNDYNREELLITPLKFEHAFFCQKTGQMASEKTSSSQPEERIFLSGTKVRAMLERGVCPPPEFFRPEVAQILQAYYRQQVVA